MSTSENRTEQDAADEGAALRDGEPAASGAAAGAVDEAAAAARDGAGPDESFPDGEHAGGGAADGGAEARELAAEVAALQDRLLRERADFENSRRRLRRDKDEAIQAANKELLIAVADVIDDLERAIRTSADADVATLRDGVSQIEKKLTGLLERKWGFRRFSSEGEPFDPERHQAIAAEESAAHEVATVVEDYQSGYLLHDRVVRPARVKVAQPLSGSNEVPACAPGDAPTDTKEGT